VVVVFREYKVSIMSRTTRLNMTHLLYGSVQYYSYMHLSCNSSFVQYSLFPVNPHMCDPNSDITTEELTENADLWNQQFCFNIHHTCQ